MGRNNKRYFIFPEIEEKDTIYSLILKLIILNNIKIPKCEVCGFFIRKSEIFKYQTTDGIDHLYHKRCFKRKSSKKRLPSHLFI